MNTIKSDQCGRHIHSPFVYRLVANVIFSPYPFYSFREIEKLVPSHSDAEESKIIFRLVNFFRFNEVYFVGMDGDLLEKICRMAKPDLNFYYQEKFPLPELTVDKTTYKRLVICEDNLDCFLSNSLPKNPEVWIILKPGIAKFENLFVMLKSRGKVKITLELTNLGIVIFNGNFEKQDYVIKT
jgi:hypothetical protein